MEKLKLNQNIKMFLVLKTIKLLFLWSAQNKFFDDNFDFVFKSKGTATGCKETKNTIKVYTKIQEIS